MTILLLGAGGLLGRYLAREFFSHDLIALTHQEADITDAARLDALFTKPWDAVINAAAVCDFDACEKDPAGTGRVNRDAPLDLARRCAAQGALFVQYSSDYVFDGEENRLLTEADTRHLLTSPDHLAVLALSGVALCFGARFVHARRPRRLLQGAGLAAVAVAAVVCRLRA